MKKQINYILVVLFLSSTAIIAQEKKLNSAQKKYDQLAYSESIKIYEELAKDGYKSK